MPGKSGAVTSGRELEESVAALGASLGLDVLRQVRVGRRIWGAQRFIDVVLRDTKTRVSLGLECKFQGGAGSAEEKIPATIQDIHAWPIRGLVVYDGDGFSDNMQAYLVSTGMAVELGDLRPWLELYFGL